MERYFSVNQYLRREYGGKLYKIALDGGFSCPNRDGTIAYGGCIFCSGAGSGDFAERSDDVPAAIERAKARVAAKHSSGKYIAYFQSFTATHGPVEKMRRLFYQAIEHEDVAVLSIATRPDCLGDEVMALWQVPDSRDDSVTMITSCPSCTKGSMVSVNSVGLI